ncbi:phosphoribosylamine--glycine ligase [Trichoderma barbatum]
MDPNIGTLRVLGIGSEVREHALAWKLSQSPTLEHVFVFHGNGGTVQAEKISNGVSEDEIAEADYPALVTLAQKLSIGLVVVGPDSAVYRIPTAAYRNFDLSVAANLESAKDYVQSVSHNVVIKASGLAAGKSVMLAASKDEACEELDSFACGRFGESGLSIVTEEYLQGDEISVLTFSDGNIILNVNLGLNTGGMGVYAPTSFVTTKMMSKFEETILKPTFDGLQTESRTFRGLLFTGVMITASGPKVLEYNVRFGDPETQSMMLPLSHDTDPAAVLLSCTQESLEHTQLHIRPGYACNVVISSAGYPGSYSTGEAIQLHPALSTDIHIFHAGTKMVGDVPQSAGGRVSSLRHMGTRWKRQSSLRRRA